MKNIKNKKFLCAMCLMILLNFTFSYTMAAKRTRCNSNIKNSKNNQNNNQNRKNNEICSTQQKNKGLIVEQHIDSLQMSGKELAMGQTQSFQIPGKELAMGQTQSFQIPAKKTITPGDEKRNPKQGKEQNLYSKYKMLNPKNTKAYDTLKDKPLGGSGLLGDDEPFVGSRPFGGSGSSFGGNGPLGGNVVKPHFNRSIIKKTGSPSIYNAFVALSTLFLAPAGVITYLKKRKNKSK